MRDTKLLYALMALLAIGLIGAGCGGDDEGDDEAVPAAEPTGATGEGGATGESGATGEGGEAGGDASASSVYEKCVSELEALGYSDFPCKQVRTSFEACQQEGEPDCEGRADIAIESLKQSGE